MADQEGNERHEPQKGNQFKITPFIPLFTPFPAPSLGQRQMARERHSRDNGPIQKRKRPLLSIRATTP
ncbi:hypothetical protein, partial [Achromobacter mucicolens]|uniref:hypothetical protein n=1 Tax=Achromobacter mucicolens TaxID=1389922 RepID=UPI0028A861C8